MPHHDDHLPAGRRDLRGAPRPRQPDVGLVVLADHRGVDVAEAVDLGAGEEPHVDPAGLQPVVEDLGHADHRQRGVGEDAVADRQRQLLGPRVQRAGLVDQHEVRCVQAARQVGRGGREPDADEARLPVAQGARGRDAHHLVRGPRRVGHAGHAVAPFSSSSQFVNAVRSRLIRSQAR